VQWTRKLKLSPSSHIHEDTRTTCSCLWRELVTNAVFCLISSLCGVFFPPIEISICEAKGTQKWSQVFCYIGGWGRQLRETELHAPGMLSGSIGSQGPKPSSVIIDFYHVLKDALFVFLDSRVLHLAFLDIGRSQFESWPEIDTTSTLQTASFVYNISVHNVRQGIIVLLKGNLSCNFRF
jgi:hypothetical protein